MAFASVEGRLPDAATSAGWLPPQDDDTGGADLVDAIADATVARERDRPWAETYDRWLASVSTMQDAFARTDLHTRVLWVAGEFTARTLATTRLAETWIHTGDVAVGLGVAVPPSDRLWHITRLAWRTLPYAFERAGRPAPGPVAFDLVGPHGDRWEFGPDGGAPTTIRGKALDLCLVASRRVSPAETGLVAEGPDAGAVLALVRTWA